MLPVMLGEMLSSKERGDKYHAAFLIMYLQGIGVLFPWNAFITCTNYYNLRFAGTSVATSYEYRMACGVPMNREISSSHLMCTSMEP